MSSKFSVSKVASLPETLQPNAVYYVKSDDGFDIHVTNKDGTIMANPLNADLIAKAVQSKLGDKVDKVSGKGLSSNDFTSGHKAKLEALEGSHFRGTFTTLTSLRAGVSSPAAGDYADVDSENTGVRRYIWDSTDAEWVEQSGVVSPLTAAQVKQLYEDNPNTNAFDDSAAAKLASIAIEATKNATDAQLRARSSHTGTQEISTVAGLWAVLDSKVETDTTYSTGALAELNIATDDIGKLQTAKSLNEWNANITSNAKSEAYTLVALDRGKSIDTSDDVTIPVDTFSIGDVVMVTNLNGSDINVIPESGVTLRKAGSADTGNITIGGYGMLTMRMVTNNVWYATGVGI